jgi:phosphomannomutase/phosphoglucomutase
MISPQLFKAYDIRGVVDQDLTPNVAEQIGRAFASQVGEWGAGEVIVGRDNRLSSPDLAEAFMAGVRAAGLDSCDIGDCATPTVYHASVTRGGLPAVMVTGSHLPPDRNGFKMTIGLDPFFGEDIQHLHQRIEAGRYATGNGQSLADPHASSRYMSDLAGRFGDSDKPFRVVIDAGNGMAGLYAPTLVRYMRHDLIELYCEPDGRYPNHPADPFEAENLHDARHAILQHGADMALIFDGDVDRLGMLDAQGVAHATDRLMIPLIWDILKRHPGAPIVTDALVSQVLIETIKGAGGQPILWKSGHSNIKNKMKEVRAPFALETSGHVFIADDYYGYDDGIYTALRMVELLSRQKTAPLHQIMAAIPQLHTSPQYRPACPEDHKQTVIEAVARHFAQAEINTIDGIRVTLPGGWFILRASNTEPKLSLRFEAESQTRLEDFIAEVEGLLSQAGVIL